jgi:hypothetical protein
VAHGGRQADAARIEAPSGLQQRRAFREVETGGADVAPGARRFAHHDALAVGIDVLLDDDGVRTSGTGAPVKMRTVSPGPSTPSKRRPATLAPASLSVTGACAASAERTA